MLKLELEIPKVLELKEGTKVTVLIEDSLQEELSTWSNVGIQTLANTLDKIENESR